MQKDKAVKVEDPRGLLDEFGIEYTADENEKVAKVLCPFHDDHNPSGLIYFGNQTFVCKACDARTNDLVTYLSKAVGRTRSAVLKFIASKDGVQKGSIVSPVYIEQCHQALLSNEEKLSMLLTRKGVTEDIVKRWKLGLSNRRVTIPVYNLKGHIVNVRMYDPESPKKVVNHTKADKKAAVFYPVENLAFKKIAIIEGELKALYLQELLEPYGIGCIAPPEGAHSWPSYFDDLFEEKDVYLLYDIDKAGRKGARKAAKRLVHKAKGVKDVLVPLDKAKHPTGGVDDWLIKEHATVEELLGVMRGTELFKPDEFEEDEDIDETEVLDLHLSQTSDAQFKGKFVRTDVLVSAKDSAPYILPERVQIRCSRSTDFCTGCPVYHQPDDEPRFTLDRRKSEVLEMIGVSSHQKDGILRRLLKVPKKCGEVIITEVGSMNIEELRLVPTFDVTSNESDNVTRRAFYVGHGIETNSQYELYCRVVPDPHTQYATLLVLEAKPEVDSLSSYTVENPESLIKFRPDSWTLESVEEKLSEIYRDFEVNVTRIYQRQDLHRVMDLVYHSALNFHFQGRLVKGWAEALIVGDTGQGKTETIKWMMQHYGLGVRSDAKGASVAGLVGGVQESAKRWFITWGKIPLQDKRMVVLEECQGMDTQVLAKMTEMRSSGYAEISKIVTSKTSARVRFVMVGNPRSDRRMAEFNFGVEALKELAGTPEDLRRFDLGLVVSAEDVSTDILNRQHTKEVEHVFTSDICKALVLWAWSRTPNQVHFEKDAEKEILAAATRMSGKFSSSIPLVEPADHRNKLSRLAVAMAARTFSATEDFTGIVVRKCHVESVEAFLNFIYSKESCGYERYSKLVNREDVNVDQKRIKDLVVQLPHAPQMVRFLMETQTFTIFDWLDCTEQDRDDARASVGELVRLGALKRHRAGYIKRPEFIALLKGITKEDFVADLPEHLKKERDM